MTLSGVEARQAAREPPDQDPLRLALDAAGVGTFDWDLTGNRIKWSRRHEQLWGFKPGEFDGTFDAFASRVQADDLAALKLELARCIAARAPFGQDFRVVWPDGGVRWMTSRGEFSWDASGRPTHLRGVVLDTTAQRQMEADLRASAANLNAAQAQANLGSWELDLSSKIGSFSREMCRLLYRDPALGMGTFADFLEHIHPDDRSALEQTLEHRPGIRQPYSIEFRTNPALGPVRYLGATIHVIRDASGRFVRAAGTVLDITERKRTAAAALRMAAIVESSGDAILSTDLNGIVTSWNRGAESMLGYAASEMLGTSIMRIVPAERRQQESQLLARCRRGETIERFEAPCNTKEGRLIQASISASAIRDVDGDILGVSMIARDVSALKDREREIERLTRLYAALSQVNQAIVWTPGREQLFQRVCQTLVEQGRVCLAWIGWHAPGSSDLVPVAHWGDEQGYLQSARHAAGAAPLGAGPSGSVLREGRPHVCNDMLAETESPMWQELTRRGFRAAAVFPIREKGSVTGTLNVYAGETGFFRDKEIALLAEAADDVSFALDSMAREAERTQADQMVRQERDFSNAVLNSLPGVMYLYDRSGRFIRWNKNFEHVTGYAAHEIAAMHPLEFFGPAEREHVAARIEEVFLKGAADVDAGFLCKDGRVIPYHFTGVATQVDGQTCLVGVGIDVAERAQAEQAQRASEARYRTLFEYAPDGILIADEQGRYVDANASVCRMLGFTREELLRSDASDIVMPDEVPQIEPALTAIKRSSDYHREWQFRRKDGSSFPAEVIATVVPGSHLLLAVIRDITERKAAEKAQRELNETLELRVAARTQDLKAALVRAEAADRIKSAFLATMSHELRTPLNSIIGFTGIVLQGLAGPLNPEQTKQLGMVRSSARHLLELINDVLDLSKIEAEQLKVHAERFDLPASIARVVAQIKPQAEKKGLILTAEVEPSLGEWVSDRRRVEQILLNLLNNAVKFTDHGRVTLTVEAVEAFRTSPSAPPCRAVRVRIADTGIGIKPEDLETLFQPFRQVDTGLTRQHEGTGLGLAICRRLATLLGGEISATSEWSRGSVFSVTLPMREAPEP